MRRVEARTGSGSGAGSQGGSATLNDRIREILQEEVVARFCAQFPEMSWSI